MQINSYPNVLLTLISNCHFNIQCLLQTRSFNKTKLLTSTFRHDPLHNKKTKQLPTSVQQWRGVFLAIARTRYDGATPPRTVLKIYMRLDVFRDSCPSSSRTSFIYPKGYYMQSWLHRFADTAGSFDFLNAHILHHQCFNSHGYGLENFLSTNLSFKHFWIDFIGENL